MSYYNYGAQASWPTQYPYIQQPQINPFQQPQMQNCQVCENRWMWIHGGREAAKSYPQAPNTTMLYMDDENPYEYFRKTDNEGRTVVFKVYPLKEEEEPTQPAPIPFDQGSYVTRTEFSAFTQDINNSLDELKNMIRSNKPQNNYRGKQVNSNG